MGELDGGTEALARVSAAVAGRDEERLREALRVAVGATPAGQVEEALLQSYLFVGYPVALNALATWREVSGTRAPDETEPPGEDFADRGRAVCRTVYGGQYERLRDNVRRLHPDMERWMVEEGYGKVLGRPGLSLAVRELCIAAILAVLDTPRQLYSHLRGALHAGASAEQVDGVLDVALEGVDDPARERAREVWSRVRTRVDTELRG